MITWTDRFAVLPILGSANSCRLATALEYSKLILNDQGSACELAKHLNSLEHGSAHSNPSSQDLLKLGVAVSGFGIATVDYITDTIMLDERAAKLFDLPANVAIPRDDLHARIHHDDMPSVEQQLACLFDPDQVGFVDVEHRVVHRDGKELWVQARKQVTFSAPAEGEDRNPISGMVAVQDISRHKNSEIRIQYLLDEMNHRAQNSIGVIQGMIRLTASSDDEQAFATRLSDRLRGMSYNHDALVKSNWEHVDLHGLIDFHLTAFVEEFETRVSIDGPPINLTPHAAQSIGMALHELATNAVKYGAFSTADGKISISWSIIMNGARKFEISWTENGGPPVVPPKRQGFGQKVLEKMASASVGGSVEMNYEPDGISWKLSAPYNQISTT